MTTPHPAPLDSAQAAQQITAIILATLPGLQYQIAPDLLESRARALIEALREETKEAQ